MSTPEARARQNIDALLAACGWVVQDRARMNLHAGRGVAVREFPLETGYADYLLFVDQKAAGVIEAKAEGVPLVAVAEQAARYMVGLPGGIPNVAFPLPFMYESTGVETFFRDNRDPQPRSRRVFAFHRPETLAEWLSQPDTLRARLRQMPERFPLITDNLWPADGGRRAPSHHAAGRAGRGGDDGLAADDRNGGGEGDEGMIRIRLDYSHIYYQLRSASGRPSGGV